MLLPWICLFGNCSDSPNGFKFMGLTAGGFVALAFLGTGALSILGDKRKNFNLKQSAIALSCGGIAAAIILWHFILYVSLFGDSDFGWGFLLAVMVAPAIPVSVLSAWFFKSPQAEGEVVQHTSSNT